MMNDLDIITKEYPSDMTTLNVYALGDVHVGSEQFDERVIREKIRIIQEDPAGVVSICGDLGDYGLKNSKTNVYRATMPPSEQKDYILELFAPIADKMIAIVPGNHEERITKEIGTCPMYDLAVLWGVPEVYRENVAITRLIFGHLESKRTKKNSFVLITTHGSSRNRHRHFIAGFDGIDAAISGHVHTQSYTPHGKIRVDRKNGTASHVAYKEIVVDANLQPGGYGLKKEYEIAAPPELQYLELTSYRDTNRARTNHKVINYHTITV